MTSFIQLGVSECLHDATSHDPTYFSHELAFPISENIFANFYSLDHTFHKTNPSLFSHVIGMGYAAGFGVNTAVKVAQRPLPFLTRSID